MGRSSEATSLAVWTFLSNHAHVLICIAQEPTIRMREIATLVGITERAVQRIIAELVEDGYLTLQRAGRRNHYSVNLEAPLRHALEAHRNISALIALGANPARKK